MKYLEMLELVKNLGYDEKHTIIKDKEGAEVFIIRPSVVPSKLKNQYDSSKNFQIWINQNYQSFKPNHLRVLIDLSLKVRAQPKLKQRMLLAFDNIFYGSDPVAEVEQFGDITFPNSLNSMEIIATLSQLFLIEQELNYIQDSHYDPKGLFFQGWVREFIDNPKEIEIMCVSAARGQPPLAKYTSRENMKSRSYSPNLLPLWYLSKNDDINNL
jgi:hypothetical protein